MSNSRVLLMLQLMKEQIQKLTRVKVSKSKFKTEVEEKVQNNNVEQEFY